MKTTAVRTKTVKRDKLIEANLDLPWMIARRVGAAIPQYGMPADELEGEAFYLLVVAAEKFKVSRGVPFRSWAVWFMSRRLRDGLRRKALHDGCHDQLPKTYDVMALDESPEDSAARHELRRQVREAMLDLNRRSRTIFELRYREDLSHSALGPHVKLKASRVSQLHGLALDELRGKLRKLNRRGCLAATE